MKIAFFSLRPEFKDNIIKTKPFGEAHEVQFFDHVLDSEHVPEDTNFDAISVFVDSTIDASVLEKFPNLKFIATRSTGYDHIDLAACAEK